jgi:hypothetical protein
MLWIHLQGEQGPGSQEPKNRQNPAHQITEESGGNNQEIKEKSYAIVVKNPDI